MSWRFVSGCRPAAFFFSAGWPASPACSLMYPRKWTSGTRICRAPPFMAHGCVGSSHVLNETSVSSCSSLMCKRISSHLLLIFSNIVVSLLIKRILHCRMFACGGPRIRGMKQLLRSLVLPRRDFLYHGNGIRENCKFTQSSIYCT